MFETLYKAPSTIAKYRRAPLLKERENADRLVLRRLRQTDPEVRLEHQGLFAASPALGLSSQTPLAARAGSADHAAMRSRASDKAESDRRECSRNPHCAPSGAVIRSGR